MVGAYGENELGRLVADNDTFGFYGYYDHFYWLIRCPRPPLVEYDPLTNLSYIPKNTTYDWRCRYFDEEPPVRHPLAFGLTAGHKRITETSLQLIIVMIIVALLQSVEWRSGTNCNGERVITIRAETKITDMLQTKE